jgi:uncharacterized repeat protein (TIGR03803 family)
MVLFRCFRFFTVPVAVVVAVLFSTSTMLAQSESAFVTLDAATTGNFGSSIMQASDGNFYAVTAYGPDRNTNGTVVQVTPTGTATAIHTFNGTTDGYYSSMLVEGPDGNLYGTTSSGGDPTCNCGTLYKLTTAGAFTVLHTFTGNYNSNALDGGEPSNLILATDGNLYGTVGEGGPYDEGGIFQVALPSATYKVAAFFTNTQGQAEGSLLQASNGSFYGLTAVGSNQGVFSAPLSGTPTVLSSNLSDTMFFQGTPLTEASDGNLYGSSYTGGPSETDPICGYGCGQIFSISPTGVYTALYSFGTGTVGIGPGGGVFLASDGNFYGTASLGGLNPGSGGNGTLFRVSPTGNATLLYEFLDGSDGDAPTYIMQGSDGNFYGTTSAGGNTDNDNNAGGDGVIFRLSVGTLSGPVQLSLSTSSGKTGTAARLSWSVSNAFSDSMQQCYAFVQGSATGAGNWTGKQTGTLNNGLYSGSATITPTVAGTYTYALTCGGIESGYATWTVTSNKLTPTVSVAVTPSPLSIGQTATVTATIAGSGATPTGSVALSSYGESLGSITLSSGTGHISASTLGLPAGQYPVLGAYSGDSNYNTGSTTTNVTLNAAPTTTTLTASPNPATPPATVTLTATVKRSASGATGTPTGSVTFSSGTTTIGTAKLNASGVAAYAASSSGLPAGSYPVTAKYTGDASDADSTSATTTVTLK